MKIPFPRRPLRALAAIVALSALAGCGGGQPPETARDAFVDLLAQGEVQAAYRAASQLFQFQETVSSFEGRIRENGLSRLSGAEWTESAESGGKRVFKGKILSRTRTEFLAEAEMVRDGGTWKVGGFKFRPAAGAGDGDRSAKTAPNLGFSQTGQQAPPSEQEAKTLAANSLSHLAKASMSGEFAEFYNAISTIWKSQVSELRLKNAFGKMAEGRDLTWITYAEVKLSEPPVINSQGLLVVQGEVEQDSKLQFFFRYIYELPDWKLFSVEASLGPGGKEAPPDRPAP